MKLEIFVISLFGNMDMEESLDHCFNVINI